MFDRNKNTKQGSSQTKAPQVPLEEPAVTSSSLFNSTSTNSTRTRAMIGSTITIKGEVTGDEDLVVDGTVEGNIQLGAHELQVGKSGKVNANITAKVVKIQGEVRGDITGKEKVILSNTGNVRGNIIAPRVTLEDGAIFKGSIDMDPGEKSTDKPFSAVKTSDKPASPAAKTA